MVQSGSDFGNVSPKVGEYFGESERKMARRRRNRKMKVMSVVHSQILRIREEDSKNLGQSILFDLNKVQHHQMNVNLSMNMDVVFFSRPVLPASPLSGKMEIKTAH